MVLIVEENQFAKMKMPGKSCGFMTDAFHQVSVAANAVSVVIDDLVPRPVIARREPGLGDRHSDGVSEPLPKWAGRYLNTHCVSALGVPRRFAAPLTEMLNFVERQIVAREVQQAVQQHGPVPGGENEAIAIEPGGILRVVLQKSIPKR